MLPRKATIRSPVWEFESSWILTAPIREVAIHDHESIPAGRISSHASPSTDENSRPARDRRAGGGPSQFPSRSTAQPRPGFDHAGDGCPRRAGRPPSAGRPVPAAQCRPRLPAGRETSPTMRGDKFFACSDAFAFALLGCAVRSVQTVAMGRPPWVSGVCNSQSLRAKESNAVQQRPPG
jgi:hypothetical protein